MNNPGSVDNLVYGLPNVLTLGRIVLIPIFVLIFYLPFSWSHSVAAAIFAFASFTDWLDGYLARRLQQISSFGAFLDPVADKLLVACALLLLVGHRDIDYITLPSMIIVGREIVVSALREWMAEVGRRTSVAVSYIGKVKTLVQMVAIFLLIACYPHTWFGMMGFLMLYIAAILTIWSMVAYLKVAWSELWAKP